MKKLRKVTSLTALWSFALLVITSVILYIMPAGRVAYWADWQLWGLSKTQWGELHINFGVLLLLSMVLHVYLNWGPIVNYMKTRAKKLRIFTPDFNLAMAVAVLVAVGTYLQVPPFSTVIALSENFKDAGSEKYGEPPYGHAELSTMKTFTARMGWNLDESLERLKQNEIQVEGPNQTLLSIARLNRLSPRHVYDAMKPAVVSIPGAELPDSPPPGIGRRPLADICQEYGINLPTLMRKLGEHKISASAELPLKDIAIQHNMAPQDLYDLVKNLAFGQ